MTRTYHRCAEYTAICPLRSRGFSSDLAAALGTFQVSGTSFTEGTRISRRLAQISQRALIRSLQVKTQISLDHCRRSILYGSYGGRIENMVIETVLFVAFVVAAGAAIVKANELYQDFLHGPYIKRAN